MVVMREPLRDMLTRSKLLVLNLAEIPAGTPAAQDISRYFHDCETRGLDPRQPAQRQLFNDRMLKQTGCRYLVSRYGEDRASMLRGSVIAKEKRTIHLGVDIFSADLEPVYAPCDGEIVRAAREAGPHTFGYYLILKPADAGLPYVFLGHLAADLTTAKKVKAGDRIATLGDYVDDENGGWSRHLHLQLFSELPPADETPLGYSSKADFAANSHKFPDPMPYFPDWSID